MARKICPVKLIFNWQGTLSGLCVNHRPLENAIGLCGSMNNSEAKVNRPEVG